MKLLLVSLISILINLSVVAAKTPGDYLQPQTAPSADSWLSDDTSFSTSISSFYTQLSGQLNSTNNGTYPDRGAIVLYVARTIYENGAKFCPTQIQSGNQDGFKWSWIDYLWDDNWKCKTFCKSGYFGSKCDQTTTNVACSKPTGWTYTLPSIMGDGKFEKRHTTEMQVLSFINETNETNSKKESYHIVLGAVKKTSHGIVASPIQVIARRGTPAAWSAGFVSVVTAPAAIIALGVVKNSHISSAQSSGSEILLCEDGYVANSTKDDCVPSPDCELNEQLQHMCDGWNDNKFNAEIHTMVKIKKTAPKTNGSTGVSITLVTSTTPKDVCYKYKCSDDNYGFTSEKDRTCIPCGENIKSGINDDGVCIKCNKGEFFKNNECKAARAISTLQMKAGLKHETEDRKCWKYTDAEQYASCVNDPDFTPNVK